jgi:branched-subunit amino acid transport protein AzlD
VNGNDYLWGVILVMALATFLTRALPFVALHHLEEHPVLMYLGRYTPPAVMTILVLYSLQDVSFSQAPYGLWTLAALLLTSLLHLWRGNALLSIFAGTLLYMALVQGVFPAG